MGQQDIIANISPNLPGFLHAANTDSQYWLAGINGDAAVGRDHCRGTIVSLMETAWLGLIFNFGKIFSLPSFLPLSEVQIALRQPASGMLCLLHFCGPNPWNASTGACLSQVCFKNSLGLCGLIILLFEVYYAETICSERKTEYFSIYPA